MQLGVRPAGFPDGYFAVYLIGLGYPAGRPLRPISKPNRRSFDEVVHWNRWQRAGGRPFHRLRRGGNAIGSADSIQVG
jgi:hypothetical protein